ncbi:MAG TPA: hypothetical protein VHI52_04100, partial [Verrucomicrobiae bacterium]|nr:hypothetical protein [Verrucomicrobiae bacterium]
LELLWSLNEEVAVLTERMDDHLKSHERTAARFQAAKALWVTNGLVAVSIAIDLLTRLKGK